MDEAAAMMYHDGTCLRCGVTDDLIRISEFGKALCPKCYPEFLRRRVEATVRRFRMIPKGSHVAVAISAGSDSATLLHTLALTRKRLNFTLSALHVHMGMGEYSDRCVEICRRQAAASAVSLELEYVADHGIRIEPIKSWPVCAVCGGVRRALMPRIARRIGARAFMTGHTLDDQLQFMLRNILSGKAVSPAPVLPATAFAPMKAKPLIQIPDEANKTYVKVLGIETIDDPCPSFIPDTHRFKQVFDTLEEVAPMSKQQFWLVLRKVMEPGDDDDGDGRECPICGEITTMRICPICRLKRAQQEGEDGAGDD